MVCVFHSCKPVFLTFRRLKAKPKTILDYGDLSGLKMAKYFTEHRNIAEHPQFEWKPNLISDKLEHKPVDDYCMLLLNSPILNMTLFLSLWKDASLRGVVDGGGNRLYDLLLKIPQTEKDSIMPHFISGDFDSIRQNVLEFYKSYGIEVHHTPDQSQTDMYKALSILTSKTKCQHVYIYCDHMGRFDHNMGIINTLYKTSTENRFQHLNLYILGYKDILWLLKPGHHTIRIPSAVWSEKSHCGLIPIGYPCRNVSTKGLKWNLHNSTLRFGALVSSSNTYDVDNPEQVVEVDTSDSLIWSMTISELFAER